MPTPITQGELAEMVPHLRGEMRKWAELSSVGSPGTTVYADSEMLKRCRAAQSKKQKSKSTKQEKVEKDADIQGQPGGKLDASINAGEGSAVPSEAGSGPVGKDASRPSSGQLD